jgi:hypothetical protein
LIINKGTHVIYPIFQISKANSPLHAKEEMLISKRKKTESKNIRKEFYSGQPKLFNHQCVLFSKSETNRLAFLLVYLRQFFSINNSKLPPLKKEIKIGFDIEKQ